MQHKLLVSLTVSTLLTACSQGDFKSYYDDGFKPKTLLPGDYTVVSETSNEAANWNGNGVLTRDRFAARNGCMRDNIYSFKAGGGYVVWSGAEKCSPNEPDVIVNGSYDIDNYPYFTFAGQFGFIKELTETTLVYEYTDKTPSGEAVKVTRSLKK